MKIALLISGYLRSYETNIDFIENQIIKKYHNVDIFLHITKNENLEDKYFNLINEERDIKNITTRLNPVSTLIENNSQYHDDKHINSTLNQWIKLYKLNKLKQINEEILNKKYDLVIRYRPDLSINGDNIFNIELLENKIYIPIESKIDKIKLRNINHGYLCDALSFGSSEIMDKYFDIYVYLQELIKKYGPVSETLLYYYLKSNNIPYELINVDYSFILSKCNVFAICGDSGSGKSTLSNLLKYSFFDSFTLECDRYHKWERHNENWKNVTHLNPDANFITKMNEDIFNLKLGREIYQVDYNHDTGKFTEKQLINPSNNLIVCGLHSLYDENSSSIYDLKIFMDTDDELKKKWKIKRDIKERGHSIDKVLESIKKRENDFNTYILPQKENADLIIKFFTNDIVDFDNLEKDEHLMLELLISKNFDVNNILLKFNNLNVSYTINKDLPKFTQIVFHEYSDIKLFEKNSELKTNTFYDYILYFIFNLMFTK